MSEMKNIVAAWAWTGMAGVVLLINVLDNNTLGSATLLGCLVMSRIYFLHADVVALREERG